MTDMTIPAERSRAVQNAADFLERLALHDGIKRVPKAVRDEARRILRHYPTDYDLADLARRAPDRWGRPET